MYNDAFETLVRNPKWKKRFIGYGNPDGDILIVGQEAAIQEGSEHWKSFYEPNQEQWESILGAGEDHLKDGWERGTQLYTFPEYFSPSFPFYKQEFHRRKTSDTYYWYQVLIDNFYEHVPDQIQGKDCKIIDFFRHAFITELNEHPRVNHCSKQPTIRENIKERFDLMKTGKPFWSRFKVVVLACGNYAYALKSDANLYADIFGVAPGVYCNQLSMNRAKSEIERIVPEIKGILNNG